MIPTFFGRLKTAPLMLALAAGSLHAQQTQSMEERLRNQLRITTTQLQQAQNELAVLKAGKAPAASADGDALKKELEATRAQLAAERGSRDRLADSARQAQLQTQAVAEKAGSQIAQYRSAYDELLRMARGLDAERQRLATEAVTQQAALKKCETANAQLYMVGQDILRAYETVDVTTVLASRQPFAAQSRVRYEQIAQEYGDKLYAGRFDVRAIDKPAAEAPAQTPDGSAASAASASSAAAAPAPASATAQP